MSQRFDVAYLATKIAEQVLGVDVKPVWDISPSPSGWWAKCESIRIHISADLASFTAADYCGDARGHGSIEWDSIHPKADFIPVPAPELA